MVSMKSFHAKHFLSVILLVPAINAQIQILNVTTDLFPAFTSTCLTVLNQVIACDPAVTVSGIWDCF